MKWSSASHSQQLGGLARSRRRSSGGGSLRSSATIVVDLGVHLVPVLDRLADVAQHALDVLHDRGRVVAVGDPVDLDVHPRLADRLALGLERAVGARAHRLELAGDVADDVEAAGG